MSIKLSVKEFSCIYYFLFSHNSCNHCASSPFQRLQFKRPNAPTLPIAPPAPLLFAFQLVYSSRRRVIYTCRKGVRWGWGCKYGGGGWHDDVVFLFCPSEFSSSLFTRPITLQAYLSAESGVMVLLESWRPTPCRSCWIPSDIVLVSLGRPCATSIYVDATIYAS